MFYIYVFEKYDDIWQYIIWKNIFHVSIFGSNTWCFSFTLMRLHQVFREVLNNLDAKCTESQFNALHSALKPDTTDLVDPVDPVRGVNLEMALTWIFSPKQKKMDEEMEAIEALRVRLASGAIIFTMDSSISTVMQLRGRVAEILGRCVDEIKLIALNRQLQDELCQDLLCEQCLEVTAVTSAIPQLDNELPVLDQLDVLRQMIMSSSLEYQLEAANHLRKLLSVGDHPPIDKILELGVAPRLLELSQQMATPELQFETLWAIVNIVSGDADQTRSIVELDAVPILLKILQEAPTVKVQEQAVWAIGNIAGDSIQHRDLCHAHGAMAAVLEVLEHCTKITCLRHAMWMVSNLCRGAPKPNLEDLIPALPLLKKHLSSGDDAELLADALWSLSYISDGPNQYIQAVIDADLVSPVVTLLSHPDQSVHTPALRSVGNLVTGSDTQTDAVLDCRPLDSVMTMMFSPRVQIRKECCWLLSNICAGSLHQVEQIRAHKFFDQFTILARDAERSVQKEAAFAIANASENKDMIKDLISAGCMTAMHELMDNNDYNIQNLCLCFISNVRKALISEDSTSPSWTEFLETFSIEDVEQMLENAGNEAVRIKAQELIDQMNSDAACRQSVEWFLAFNVLREPVTQASPAGPQKRSSESSEMQRYAKTRKVRKEYVIRGVSTVCPNPMYRPNGCATCGGWPPPSNQESWQQ